MDIIRWEKPPMSEHDKAVELVNKLTKSPGKWALVAEGIPGSEASDLSDLLVGAGTGNVETKIIGEVHRPRSVYVRVVSVGRSGWNGDR